MNDMITPEKALELYQSNVEANYDGAMPILLYATKDTFVPCGIGGPMPDGGMQDMLLQLIPKLLAQFGKPEWLSLSSECWMRKDFTKEKVTDHAPGDFARQRAAGDLDVMEAIQIITMSKTESWSLIKPFERAGGETIWGELALQPEDAKLEGGIPDIFMRALTIPDEVVEQIATIAKEIAAIRGEIDDE